MSRMSFQPSHLEYKDVGESSSCAFTRFVRTTERNVFFNFSALSHSENEEGTHRI